jgi:hypothetical protein
VKAEEKAEELAYDIAKARSDLLECDRDVATFQVEVSDAISLPTMLQKFTELNTDLGHKVAQLDNLALTGGEFCVALSASQLDAVSIHGNQ